MLTESENAHEQLLLFLYRAPIGLMQTALDGTIELVNPMCTSLLMPLSHNGNLDNLFTLLEEVAPHLREWSLTDGLSNGSVCEAVRIVLPAGISRAGRACVLSISLLKLDETRLMATVSDVTLEVQREEAAVVHRLGVAARTDALTQMPNRVVMRDIIQRAIDRGHADAEYEFAILFMNGDRFKKINDSLGHAVGDEVLGLMAGRIRSALRKRNRDRRSIVDEPRAGRLGGDEFVVLIDNLRSPQDVHSIAQRLLNVFNQPYSVRSNQLHFTASIGVVLRAQAAGDADAVLQNASLAMVEAKRLGRARYVLFEPAMLERAARRGDVEIDLHRALLDHQLFVVYQPVVSLQGDAGFEGLRGRGVDIEALVRWRHPTRGVVPPAEFIGVAEECGLIGALGRFVLETACHQFVDWQQTLGQRAPGMLAVNLSRGQLSDPGLVEFVRETLRSSRMQARHLQLEVTESLAAQDELVQTRLRELKDLGLSLALDDFGTGYSSLSSLHQLPVTTVKIDRSFVSEAVTSAHHRVLIEATVRVADSLNMDTVAEGIETEAQAALVRSLGCKKAQGYFFSRPLLASDLAQWVTSENPKAQHGKDRDVFRRT